MRARFIYEKFSEDSDPIEDMGIGKPRWLAKVKDYFIKEVFGDEYEADLFMDIAKEKLEELYQKEVLPEEAADICYSDINLYEEWDKMHLVDKMTSGNSAAFPGDDLKANCRSLQGAGDEDTAKELTSYLIGRYPDENEDELRELAYDWVGYDPDENEEDIDESYIMRPLSEKFSEDSDPIEDMGIGRIPYHYDNLYIAKHDIEYVTNGKKVKVPKGTVIIATGGGCYGNHNGDIVLLSIQKINGKPSSNYELRKDKNNYTEIYYDVWEKSRDLASEIDDWFRDNLDIENAAKMGDIQKVYKAIENQHSVIKKIKKLIK